MTDTNVSKKEILDEIVNRGKLGNKKFHSETSLQQFGEDEGVNPSELGTDEDPGVCTTIALKGNLHSSFPVRIEIKI